MKRTSGLIFASTLVLLMSPLGALAQYDAADRQCIYSHHRQSSQDSIPTLPAPLLTDKSVISVPTSATEKAETAKIASEPESKAGEPIELSAKISKSSRRATRRASKRASKLPQPLSLKITEDQFSRTLLPGSTFTIELENELTSNDAAVGDKIGAHLTQDLQVGEILLAPKGAKVEGSVSKVYKACKGIKTNKMNGHFRNSNGGIQMEFNKLVGSDGISYAILALPAVGSAVQKSSSGEQKLVISKHGEVGVPYHAKKYETIAFAITASSMAAGPFGFAAAPALSALIGGVCPAYGLGRPSKPGEKHPRVKGALMGALRGTPGGFITSGFLVQGLDAKVSSGDQLILQLSQPLSVPGPVKELSSIKQ